MHSSRMWTWDASFVCGLYTTVRGAIPTFTPRFPDLIFGPWKKLYHVFGCSSKAYVVSYKVGTPTFNMFLPLAPELNDES